MLDKTAFSASLELKNHRQIHSVRPPRAEGIPAEGKRGTPYANGLTLAVSYMDHEAIRDTSLAAGTNFTAVVTVSNSSPRGYNHLVLTEVFPAGWEILNTRFLTGDTVDNQVTGVNYQDIRDDRAYSYIDYLPAGKQVTVRINLCAVYPGRFYLPPVYCEAMYDHLVRANTEGKMVTVE